MSDLDMCECGRPLLRGQEICGRCYIDAAKRDRATRKPMLWEWIAIVVLGGLLFVMLVGSCP